MKKKGFFGGTFDPIHLGHLNLAVQLLEMADLDEVHFCPANISPSKKDFPPIASSEHRCRMVELAIKGVPQFSLIQDDIKRSGPSYTIDTISQLVEQAEKKGEKVQYYLMMADLINELHHWKNYERLVQLAPPLFGGRSKEEYRLTALPTHLREVIYKGFYKISIMEISSTTIRQRLKSNLYCGHLLDGKVLDYISQYRLYF